MHENNELIDGVQVRWLSTESLDAIIAALEKREFGGIGFNPYRGWKGNLATCLGRFLPINALALPFGDRIGLNGGWISLHDQLRVLLLSEFTGKAHINNDKLEVLRLLVKPGITFGSLPKLVTLYLRNPNNHTLIDLNSKTERVETLQVNGGSVSSIEPWGKLANLRYVELSNIRKLRSLSPLSACGKLEVLTLESLHGLHDLESSLKQLTSLRVLRLIDCGSIPSLDFLEALNLEEFRCSRTKIVIRDDSRLIGINNVFVG